jgi:hypothetical protein
MFTPYEYSGSHAGPFVSVTIAALAPRCCQSIARARVREHRPGRIRIQGGQPEQQRRCPLL